MFSCPSLASSDSTTLSAAAVSHQPYSRTTIALTYILPLVDLLTSNLSNSAATFTNPASDLELLERALLSVSEMLDRVLSYVQSVLSGEVKGDSAVGRYLMDALGPSTEDLEKGEFNSHLQVCFLMPVVVPLR